MTTNINDADIVAPGIWDLSQILLHPYILNMLLCNGLFSLYSFITRTVSFICCVLASQSFV